MAGKPPRSFSTHHSHGPKDVDVEKNESVSSSFAILKEWAGERRPRIYFRNLQRLYENYQHGGGVGANGVMMSAEADAGQQRPSTRARFMHIQMRRSNALAMEHVRDCWAAMSLSEAQGC